jgi:hypothetical protein
MVVLAQSVPCAIWRRRGIIAAVSVRDDEPVSRDSNVPMVEEEDTQR